MELNSIPIIINIFNMFNNISSYIYEDDRKEIKLYIDCQITKRANRTKTPRIEDYELFRHYCTEIQELLQTS